MNTKQWLKVAGVATGIAAFGVYLGLFTLSKYQEKLIYMPDMPRYPAKNSLGERHPREAGLLNCQDVEIQTEDNVKLRGWIILSDNPRNNPTLIYYQENAGNIGQRIPFIRFLMDLLPINILIVAYRGYSESQGVPSEYGLKLDGQAILDYASFSMDIDNNNIYILGRSLGGAVACHVASNAANRLKIKGVILENTFTSISDVATRKFYLLSKLIAPFLRNKWESINEIRSFACPILFIVGEIIVYLGKKDQLIPYYHTEQLIKTAKNYHIPATVYTIQQGTHNYMWQADHQNYIRRLATFMNLKLKH